MQGDTSSSPAPRKKRRYTIRRARTDLAGRSPGLRECNVFIVSPSNQQRRAYRAVKDSVKQEIAGLALNAEKGQLQNLALWEDTEAKAKMTVAILRAWFCVAAATVRSLARRF